MGVGEFCEKEGVGRKGVFLERKGGNKNKKRVAAIRG